MRKIVCIIGPSCAGKTTFCNFLREKIACKSYQASSVSRKRHKESECGATLMEFVINEFNSKGMTTFAQELFRKMKDEVMGKSLIAIIDGFRACEEVDLFRDNFNEVVVYGVYADSKTRYKRHIKRFRDSSILTYEQFIKKDMIEYDFGIARMLENYVHDIIINEDTIDSLEDKATLLTKRL